MSEGGRRLSVMHVCAPAEFGGLERVVQGLSRGLAARGHRVAVVAVVEPGHDAGPFLDPMKEAGVRTEVVRIPRRAYARELIEVGRLLSDIRPDILHTHGHRPDLLHPLRARNRGIATVTTLHGFTSDGGYSSFLETVQRRALLGFEGVVAVSKPLVEMLVSTGVSARAVHHVPNAWEPPDDVLPLSSARRHLGLGEEEQRVIGWVGRLAPIKGPDVFLLALRELAGMGVQGWTACIVGDGPERGALKDQARGLGIDDRVHFAGVVHDAPRSFTAFDVFALTSRSEGTPMALLEAMGAAVPAVATRVGGVPDVVEHGSTGWVVPPEDPLALAVALRQALLDEREAMRRGTAGKAKVLTSYGIDSWIARHEQVYRCAKHALRV